jgi:alpha-tubulin suppressor-like RCC1 family protein
MAGIIASVGCTSPPAPMPDASMDAEPTDTAQPRPDTGVCEDQDNDGHPSAACGGDDCDDNNPRRNPGVREVCDGLGVDEDCDPCTVAEVLPNGRGGDGDRDEDGVPSSACFNAIAPGAAVPMCTSASGDAGTDGGAGIERVRVSSTGVRGTDCADDPAAGGATRFPGAAEICNMLDDDCDEMVDESVSARCYPDVDGDSFAASGAMPSMEARGCGTCPVGFTTTVPAGLNIDCDDADPARFPRNREECDGKDNDCRADTDDAFNDARVGQRCMGPGSGVGRCAMAVNACVAGVIACNAAQPLPEMCNAIDDDCDGATDEGLCVDSTLDSMGRPTPPTGYGSCNGSTVCSVQACVDNRGDCDNNPSNGCETNTLTDSNHCGACGTQCVFGACNNGHCDTPAVRSIAVGYYNSCAISTTDRVACWGNNAVGQLGSGTALPAISPPRASVVTDAVEVALSEYASCARLRSGRVQCWGLNIYGQWGNGTVSSSPALVPRDVPTISDAVELVAGGHSFCVRRASGRVVCWGRNVSAQLGIGVISPNNPTPTEVAGLTDAVEITANMGHACARRESGRVVCWGNNTSGQAGDGTSGDPRLSPTTEVQNLTDAVEIAAGSSHVCARTRTGSVLCWGNPTGGSPAQSTPIAVAGLDDAVAISVGNAFACAVRRNGATVCWGQNNVGQLGDGTTVNRSTLLPVNGLTDAVEVASKFDHSCALRANGEVVCWGRGDFGQTGVAAMTLIQPLAAPVRGLDPIVDVESGWTHACARRASGRVRCWGDNEFGQLGDGTMGPARPSAVDVPGVTDAVSLALGASHSCARRATGDVVCWGANSVGQLGTGAVTATPMLRPTAVSMLSGVVEIRARFNNTCARLSDGSVRCWGANVAGQIGDGTQAARALPVRVLGITDAVELSFGVQFACARRSSGQVMCWGRNSSGAIGNGLGSMTATPELRPTAVTSLSDAIALASGQGSSCAIRTSGQVWCWGSNDTGQCATGALSAIEASPVRSSLTVRGRDIALGGWHGCARVAMGAPQCWGANNTLALGIGPTPSLTSTPLPVPAVSDAFDFTAGLGFTCARRPSGELWCWGANERGQTGNGSITMTAAAPGPVRGL